MNGQKHQHREGKGTRWVFKKGCPQTDGSPAALSEGQQLGRSAMAQLCPSDRGQQSCLPSACQQRTNTNSCLWGRIIPGKGTGWAGLASRKAVLAVLERLCGHGGQQAGQELQRALAAREASSILGHSQDMRETIVPLYSALVELQPGTASNFGPPKQERH